MTELQIKKNALEAFKNNDYENAFHTLWELGVEDFLQFAQKEEQKIKKYNWFAYNNQSKGYSYFWNTFVLQENVFKSCFTSSKPVELLHNYYSKTTIFNKAFEIELAKQYPTIFIESIRKNEVFFKESRIDFLLKEDLLIHEYQIHQDVWESFQIQELRYWNEIKSTITKLEKYSLEQILFFTVEYFETNNFENNFDIINQSHLAYVYSFFMDLILRNPSIKHENLSSEAFEMAFVESVYENEYPELKKAIFKVLDIINKRQVLNSRFFQPYCFNAQFQPKYIYESLHFYESPESHYQWNVDELRYRVSELAYNIKGTNIVEAQLKNGAVIENKSKREEDYLDNKTLAFNLQGIIETLNDLKLANFYFKDSSPKDIKVEIEKIIKPLCVYAFNRYTRYYKVLKNIRNANSALLNNWQKAYLYLATSNEDSSQFPFVYNTKQEYLDLNSIADENFENKTGFQVLNQFGFNRSKLNKFDRFNVRYSVIENPFVIIDDYIFSPILFFVNFSSQNVFVNSLLKNNNRRTAIQIEDKLESVLLKYDFGVFRPTKKEAGLIDGDADIILYDKDNVLLMQLKRTNLRLDYKAQYYEYINTDLKASIQLNNAEKFLSKENSVFNIENRKVTKWIVSNSFEKVNTQINNCSKVNYLDIVSFLTDDNKETFNSLPGFISFFENDSFFKMIVNPLIDNDDMYRKMLSLTNIDSRNLLWKDFDSNKGEIYRHFYDKGIELNKKGEHKNAIKSLKKCLELENEDVEVHGAIANIYADLKNYEKAFFHFKKALDIIPNNPFVLRNYAIALRESGDNSFLQVYSQITEKYPFLNY
ncbi:tetratricopeptide repeat protein [uncultured Olleya sp.]|uniref:tetratricopeptide repeat protein n=1 Tax=uncultured Olleya sp. TaxID=757243 RepID=UPI002597C041|nr:tetratricopeptide repeat protein [uncultured Olleya sp.]